MHGAETVVHCVLCVVGSWPRAAQQWIQMSDTSMEYADLVGNDFLLNLEGNELCFKQKTQEPFFKTKALKCLL